MLYASPTMTLSRFLLCLPLALPALTAPLQLRIPERHPYITLSPDQIRRARQNEQSRRILAEADKWIQQPWKALPPRGDVEHRAIGSRIFNAALAYAFSGEKRYAEWARDGLLAYAALYPELPMARSRKNRLFTQSPLYEATWVVSIAQAYDLVAEIFTPEQARRVEQDLLRKSAECFKIDDFERDERIRDLHFRCYNFQAWHISAVGLAGLASRDTGLVDWAVNSRYGLRHLIAHDINDDGMFWERSQSYHEFVLRALLPFTEAMLRCGVDLYSMSVPAERTRDEDAHYMTDTSDRPKSLRMMFEPLFYTIFPDLSYPALGDSNRGPLRPNAVSLIGAVRYRDPKLLWLLSRPRAEGRSPEWQWLAYETPSTAQAAWPLQEGRFANTGDYRNGCSLFPSTGLAVLREASGDFTSQPDSTAVSLSFGPHGGGHGHSDALNLVLYAQGRQWIPDFGSMPYETHWKAEWTAQSVSHNTIVADGISQNPTGKRNTQWPSDTAADRVLGLLDRFDAPNKAAGAHYERAYDGIRLSRAVNLAGSAAVDVFDAASGTEHQYDYVLHIDGALSSSSAPLEPASGKLGEICGYQLVEQKRRGHAAGPFQITFAADGKQLRIWSPGNEPTEIIVGEGLTNSPEQKMPMLILRRKAAATRFVSVFEPVKAGAEVRSVRLESGRVVIGR